MVQKLGPLLERGVVSGSRLCARWNEGEQVLGGSAERGWGAALYQGGLRPLCGRGREGVAFTEKGRRGGICFEEQGDIVVFERPIYVQVWKILGPGKKARPTGEAEAGASASCVAPGDTGRDPVPEPILWHWVCSDWCHQMDPLPHAGELGRVGGSWRRAVRGDDDEQLRATSRAWSSAAPRGPRGAWL